MYKPLAPCLLLLSLTACQMAPTADVATTPKTSVSQSHQQLQRIMDDAWQLRLESSPEMAYAQGDETAAGKLDDLSPEALANHNQAEQALLARLNALDLASLNKADRIDAQILIYQLQNSVDQYRFHDHYLPITAESGFHAYIASIAKGNFNSEADYRNYLSKLEALPRYFSQQTYWLKQGLAQGITPARVVLNGFEESISAFIVPVEQSGYFKPFTHFPKHFTQAQKAELTEQGKALIEQNVLPSYQAFYDFMTQEYIPGARESIAAYDLPDGKAFYENRVRYYTTLPMTADEVHQLGLKEVKRIRAEMQAIIDKLGYQGSFADFLHFLRTDPQF